MRDKRRMILGRAAIALLAGADAGRGDDTVTVEGIRISRSVATPVQRYKGGTLRIATALGSIQREPFYGAAMVIEYVVSPPAAIRSRRLEERFAVVYESHNLGLPQRWSAPIAVDGDGVWTDVIAVGDGKPLPKDWERIVRQDVVLDGRVIASGTILFRSDMLRFETREPEQIPGVKEKLRRRSQAVTR